MNIRYSLLPGWMAIVWLMVGMIMNACAADAMTWREEVLMHDGNKIIVTRSQTRGGSHEIGQPPPVKEHAISFVLPGTNKTITWVSEYGKDVGRSNFDLLAVHVLDGVPYIVASPNLCLSYNKWGRPNPPYVFFKYDGKDWKRISLSEFPTEFKTINVAADTLGDESKLVALGFVSVEEIKKLNSEFKQPEYRSIVREPVKGRSGLVGCEHMIPYGKGGWLGLDWFQDQPSYDACLKFCERKGVRKEDCPCGTLFKGEK